MTPEKRKLIEASFNRSETLKFYNALLIECETDYVSIKIPKQEMMTRKHGMFNGAMIASLVDVSSGYAAVSHYEDDCYVVTVELKVNYLRPALGDYLLSKAYVIKGGKKISTIRTEVYVVNEETGKETHAATSLVTMMRIK
ncbi:PaaI family thioesterase [Empedobacter stercoris]|uniref:PaaI family thioesterase n=2 Tax=Empedobacter TaxID=59734 RepID=A0ABY8V7E1_9FLAO|nr:MULTISPECIES: PaaI family thioesterase [Empedobacter]MCA4781210.1 PaaI family thioesterase [Empedobacter stercoris]MCA4810526.1 PaaI family thioesterase [Empedobacter stercoris]NOJ76649.1 PaaI family thioesterase [Empedobacter stercoris]QNT13843.1 PaaI family thioesterase [Empedobacter stercoris]UWX67106.1 PaaI family thioesterase [Empedobacter stercoris]